MFNVLCKTPLLRHCCLFRACGTKSNQRFYSVTKKNVKKQSIEKLLIANRGEIACRIMRTAKK